MIAAAVSPTRTIATTIVRKLPETLIRCAGVSTAVRSLIAAITPSRAIRGRSQFDADPRRTATASAPTSAVARTAIAVRLGRPVGAFFMAVEPWLEPPLVPPAEGPARAHVGRGRLTHRLDEALEVVARVAALAAGRSVRRHEATVRPGPQRRGADPQVIGGLADVQQSLRWLHGRPPGRS